MTSAEQLAERYVLDGDLDAAECRQLSEVLRAGGADAARVRESMVFVALMGQALADDGDDGLLRALDERLNGRSSRLLRTVGRSLETASARRRAVRRSVSSRWSGWLVAAAAMLVLGVVALWPRHGTPSAAIIASLRAAPGARVEVVRDQRAIITSEVYRGDVINVQQGTAVVVFLDATDIALASGAAVVVEEGQRSQGGGAKRLLLTHGTIDVAVVPQPRGEPLRVRTPHAEVTVVGTRLRIAVAAVTTVSVQQGSVQVADLAAGGSSTLAAGQSRTIAASPTMPDASTEPVLPRPIKGAVVSDPVHRTELVRITDTASDVPGGIGFLATQHAARSAFNADGTRCLLYGADGCFHLYDAATFRHLRILTAVLGDSEPQWDPSDGDVLCYLSGRGGLQIHRLHVAQGMSTVVCDLSGRLPWPGAVQVSTKDRGSPSLDGQFWHLLAQDRQGKALGALVWDRHTDAIVATYDLTAGVDPVGVDTGPAGERVVIYGATVGGVHGTWSFTRTFSEPVLLHRGIEYADLGRDADGHDVLVSVTYDTDPELPSGHVFMTDLRSGRRTPLLPLYVGGAVTAVQISAGAAAKPGWAVLSTYAERGHPWYARKVLALELRAAPRVVALAYDRWAPAFSVTSPADAYWATPQAVPDRTLSRILFNSTWGSGRTDQLDTYVIRLGPDVLPPAPSAAP